MKRHILETVLALSALSLAGVACSSGGTSTLGTGGDDHGAGSSTPVAPGVFDNSNNPGPGGTPPPASTSSGGTTASSSGGSGASSGSTAPVDDAGGNAAIDDRVINYGEALRTASIKLIGVFPPLADIQAIAAASPADQATMYAAKIDAMLADPRFAATQIEWWRNTFRTGAYSGDTAAIIPKTTPPSFDTAATFAASVVVADQPYTDILTASSGTCPTFSNGTFTPADCNNNAPTSGVLTDPGIQAQYFSHMAMRRARFIQEIFACSAFPTEFSATPEAMGSGFYTSPWPFDSITGGSAAKIDFQSTSAIICANCHTSINHIAPLFSYFDANGQYQSTIQVQTPVTPPVTSVLSDWLPAGEQTFAWRYNTAVTDIPSLGKAMAADPDVQRCAATRVWNWAFSRGDVVNDVAPVPTTVTDSYLTTFQTNFSTKSLIRAIFTSQDFILY
jgi:hypothetical protein